MLFHSGFRSSTASCNNRGNLIRSVKNMKTLTHEKKPRHSMTIGQLARRAGVSAHTIRYYEKIGVLENRERATNGYRTYTEGDFYALRLVRRARLLGVSLAEIKELASTLWKEPKEKKRIKETIEIWTVHVEEAREKIEELQAYVAAVDQEIRRLRKLL